MAGPMTLNHRIVVRIHKRQFPLIERKIMCGDKKQDSIETEISESFIKSRKVFLWGAVDDKLSKEIVQKLLYLDSQSNEDITLYINSPGGSVIDGFAILDAIDSIKSDVVTIVTGFAASMGAIIQMCGAKGKRYIWPRGKIMIHQPLINGVIEGVTADINIRAEQIEKTRAIVNKIISDKTGKTLEQVIKDTDRDFWLTAEESLEYGLVDKIEAKN